MIVYWRHHVVRLSVCLYVTLCIVALRVGVQLYQRVPSRQVPICPYRHFCCSAPKKTSRRKRELRL